MHMLDVFYWLHTPCMKVRKNVEDRVPLFLWLVDCISFHENLNWITFVRIIIHVLHFPMCWGYSVGNLMHQWSKTVLCFCKTEKKIKLLQAWFWKLVLSIVVIWKSAKEFWIKLSLLVIVLSLSQLCNKFDC